MKSLATPKIFVSYSWSSPEHQEWVLDLSESLMTDGIDIVLDKWELREGADSHAFMERMVNDESVTKIIMIIDSKYTERANTRIGGVGTESTILSNELYTIKDKHKIVAVIAEPSAKKPTFYAGRIHIDLSNPDSYVKEYEKLVRWAFDKYEYEKPKSIGKPPSFITIEDSSIALHTNTEFRIALDALEKGKLTTSGNIKNYLNKLDSELIKLSVEGDTNKIVSENFKNNLNSFQPHLLEFQKIIDSICTHTQDAKLHKHIRYFFESLLSYLQVMPNTKGRSNHDLTLFEFIIYQLFLSYVALLLKHESFFELKEIFEELFITPEYFHKYDLNKKYMDFRVFRPEHDRLAYKELMSEKISPLAAILQDLNNDNIINFNQIIEADLLLYIKSLIIIDHNKEGFQWWPYTGLYRSDREGALRVFIKSQKTTYFSEVKNVLGIEDLKFINNMIPDEYNWSNSLIPRWREADKILNIRSLTNYIKLEPQKSSMLDIL